MSDRHAGAAFALYVLKNVHAKHGMHIIKLYVSL